MPALIHLHISRHTGRKREREKKSWSTTELKLNQLKMDEDNINEKQPFLHYLQYWEYTESMSAWLVPPPLPSFPLSPPPSAAITPVSSHLPPSGWVIHRVYPRSSGVSIITPQSSGAEGSWEDHGVQQILLSTARFLCLICILLMRFCVDKWSKDLCLGASGLVLTLSLNRCFDRMQIFEEMVWK